jgi:hypothetical protein
MSREYSTLIHPVKPQMAFLIKIKVTSKGNRNSVGPSLLTNRHFGINRLSMSDPAILQVMIRCMANPIAICKFAITGTLSLTPRAGSRWDLCAAREARRAVWQREQ